MILEWWQYLLAGLAALAGGAVNALAGGGTLITFPMLTFIGIPAVAANITNTVALCPGYLGATLAQMTKATGWQGHSVRGFLSGALRKKRGLTVLTDRVDGILRYRLGKGA